MACFAICFGFALGSNMIANCSNTTVFVGVTIFALRGPVGVVVGFEATRFLSATGVGSVIGLFGLASRWL